MTKSTGTREAEMKMFLLLAIAVIIMVAPTLTPAENTKTGFVGERSSRHIPVAGNDHLFTKIAKAP